MCRRLRLLGVVLCAFAIAGCGRIYYDPVGGCGEGVTTGTLALYSFEGVAGATTVRDSTGNHDGMMTRGPATAVAGPPGCGDAMAFPASGASSYFVIPNSMDWELDQGSIDLWVRFAPVPSGTAAGVVSRDALGTAMPGHFALLRIPDGRLLARVQRPGSPGRAARCSTGPVPDQTWMHVVVSFGPPTLALAIDGVVQTGRPDAGFWGVECGTDVWPGGISGNANPWVVGASTAAGSAEGSAEPTDSPLRGGAVDHLRISSVRRGF